MLSLNGSAFTSYGWAVCFWSLIIPFQYGYHISVLNQIQGVLTCKVTALPTAEYALKPCIPMSDFTFSLVTAIFTIGGLAGSLVANLVMDRWGRKGTNRICTVFIAVGTALMGFSNSVLLLLLGRFAIGIASGLGLCVGPIYLSEIAPSKISGSIGVLTQLSVVFGIMFTQLAGINLAYPSQWRFVFFLSFCLSVFQFLSSSVIVESPAFLLTKQRVEEQKSAARRLWGNTIPSLASEESLLDEFEDSGSRPAPNQENVGVPELFSRLDLRKPLMIVSLAMVAQQVSGINAVLYYSNEILAKSLPEFGSYISLGITVINVIMTFPAIILIERLGRKSLLGLSASGAILSLLVLGFALGSGSSTISSVAIVTFVMSFAVGLGPVPFVMIPEVSPPRAVSALSSVALSLNWIANFIVGLAFLPLRNLLSGGDMYKEGRVFYVFVLLFTLATGSLFKFYRTVSTFLTFGAVRITVLLSAIPLLFWFQQNPSLPSIAVKKSIALAEKVERAFSI